MRRADLEEGPEAEGGQHSRSDPTAADTTESAARRVRRGRTGSGGVGLGTGGRGVGALAEGRGRVGADGRDVRARRVNVEVVDLEVGVLVVSRVEDVGRVTEGGDENLKVSPSAARA